MTFTALRSVLCAILVLTAASARAQESLLIAPVVPDDFDRGRNVSVVDRPRPDYDPLGIYFGAFVVRPSLQTDVGYDSNLFLVKDGKTADAYLFVGPRVVVRSDWSRHALGLSASGGFRRNFDTPRRNEDTYDVSVQGTLEATTEFTLSGQAQQSRVYESPLTGAVNAPVSALSNYDRTYVTARGEYRAGQVRAFLSADYSYFDFSTVRLSNGTVIDQRDRNRDIARVTGQGEYALTPSASIFAQASYEYTDYDLPMMNNGSVPNLGSNGVRVLGGLNFDLAGLMRGSIGLGYVNRNYQAAAYRSVNGVSVEGRLEWFPSELTTVTLTGRRLVADSVISATSAFFDNRAGLRVDHELLSNMLIYAEGEAAYIDYIDSPLHNWVFRLGAGSRYFISRNASLRAMLSYSTRTANDNSLGSEFDQFKGQIGLNLAI